MCRVLVSDVVTESEIANAVRDGDGSAPGACHPGGEADGEGAWPLSKLIETLPLD